MQGVFDNPVKEFEDWHTVLGRAASEEVIVLCKSKEDGQYFYYFSEEGLVRNFLSLFKLCVDRDPDVFVPTVLLLSGSVWHYLARDSVSDSGAF